MKTIFRKTLGILLIALTIIGCRKETIVTGGNDWTTATHNSSTPNHSVVFDDDKVHRIDLVITADDWTTMQDDIESIYGGASSGPGQFSDQTPIYIPCQFYYDDIQWYNVGVRYKGNSSLSNVYGSGISKLPLRFKFDEYDYLYPEITGQDFYGFTELSMSSNFDDKSLIREKAASDLFKDFGVPCSRAAFYRVYVDYGDGPIYFGMYTMLEVVFDTALENCFNSNSGNCYKPDGSAASFADGTYNISELENKTDGTDWSDVESLYNIINSSDRTSNPSAWRTNLESVFNVDGYLKYLAVNNTIQNWDTYGRMTHNYYLYNDPVDGKLNWIPWDNNEAFQDGKMGGAMEIDGSDIGADWPLVNYLLTDDTYEAQYKNHLRDFVDNYFNSSIMSNKYNAYYSLIEQYVTGVDGEIDGYSFLNSSGDFSSALSELTSHVSFRTTVVNNYAP